MKPNTYAYKGYEIWKSATGTSIYARKMEATGQFTLVANNAPSAGQAAKQLEDFIASK